MGKHSATGRKPRRTTETADFVAMLTRLMIAWGDRVADDPEALVHVRELQETLVQQTNRGMWEANERHRYSQNHMAAIFGVSRQAVAKRIGLGRLAAAAITERRGGGALVTLAEIRGRRARLLAAAGVPDEAPARIERLRAVV